MKKLLIALAVVLVAGCASLGQTSSGASGSAASSSGTSGTIDMTYRGGQ